MNHFYVVVEGRAYTRNSKNRVYTHAIVCDRLSQRPYWSDFQKKQLYPQSYEDTKAGKIPRWFVWGWASCLHLAELTAARARKHYPIVGIHDVIQGKPPKAQVVS